MYVLPSHTGWIHTLNSSRKDLGPWRGQYPTIHDCWSTFNAAYRIFTVGGAFSLKKYMYLDLLVCVYVFKSPLSI